MKYLLFGAGRIGRRMLRLLGEDSVIAFIDNHKVGSHIDGKDVFSLAAAVERYPGTKILLSIKDPELSTEVEQQLSAAGLSYMTFASFFLHYLEQCREEGASYYQTYSSEIDYMLERHCLVMLPESFYDAYAERSFPYQEEGDGLVSFLRNGRRVYLPKHLHVDISGYIRSLFAEQDPESPHQYFSENHSVSIADTFVDVGGAEAMTSVDVIEKANRIIIFEGDPIWQKALEKTFAPYQDIITIVPKYVGSMDDDHTVKMDTYFQNERGSLFFKVDIEGSEREFLKGAEKTLRIPGTKISICTYHRTEDAEDFLRYFEERGYACTFSDGHIFANGEFVKGVLRGEKRENRR